MPRFTESQQAILAATKTWVDLCLRDDSSVLSGKSLWNLNVLDEFRHLYVENLIQDDREFLAKYEEQLKNGTTEVKQLGAEILWLLLLFTTGTGTEKKGFFGKFSARF